MVELLLNILLISFFGIFGAKLLFWDLPNFIMSPTYERSVDTIDISYQTKTIPMIDTKVKSNNFSYSTIVLIELLIIGFGVAMYFNDKLMIVYALVIGLISLSVSWKLSIFVYSLFGIVSLYQLLS